MQNQNIIQTNIIEPTSHLWSKRFADIRLPADGIVVEIAPGYEPKIGNALLLRGFHGTVFIVEPDKKAARHIYRAYQNRMPTATIKIVSKLLQNVVVGTDIPVGADAIAASHPFDDMVMAYLGEPIPVFSKERRHGMRAPRILQKFYHALHNEDYARSTRLVTAAWQNFLETAQPEYFIASQYPSHTLAVLGLAKRQESGFMVLRQLKQIYKSFLVKQCRERQFSFKGDPKWWIAAKKPRVSRDAVMRQRPYAMDRLGKTIFAPQRARLLSPQEYDIVYIDREYFKNSGLESAEEYIRKLAIVLDDKKRRFVRQITAYADRQKDKTDISLSGNRGSGRAIYYGGRFQILGVGKTTLCKSKVPSHSTGVLELVGAMRRIVLSKWINHFTKRAPDHVACIALKKTIRFKWNAAPIPLCLLVRIDCGDLDRPSHVEQLPSIPVDFEQTLKEYARLDAEYFAYRILLGAWSTNNYSLGGCAIDLESASFVKYRGPYYTSSSRYPHNRFGYEGSGFLKILRQLASAKRISKKNIKTRFFRERRKHLGRCFLLLLGIADDAAQNFFLKHSNRVMRVSDQFEKLSKKINSVQSESNLYAPIAGRHDPSLLDMSRLFRNLARLYKASDAETKALECLIRKTALARVSSGAVHAPTNHAETLLRARAIITSGTVRPFLNETKKFIHDLFTLLAILDSWGYLSNKKEWRSRLFAMNQNLPIMFALNATLKSLAESYRLEKINPETLGMEINQLCALPKIKSAGNA